MHYTCQPRQNSLIVLKPNFASVIIWVGSTNLHIWLATSEWMTEEAMDRSVEWSRVLRIRRRSRTDRKHDLDTDEIWSENVRDEIHKQSELVVKHNLKADTPDVLWTHGQSNVAWNILAYIVGKWVSCPSAVHDARLVGQLRWSECSLRDLIRP